MEDILDVYQGTYDEQHPLVCMDESPKQLRADVQAALPLEAGQPRREDYEYQREGTCNLFVAFAPVQGWREVAVTERRGCPLVFCSGGLFARQKDRPPNR